MTESLTGKIVTEVRKAVREEIRIELILSGLVDCPMHWETQDRETLAAHLRDLAERLDPKGGQ